MPADSSRNKYVQVNKPLNENTVDYLIHTTRTLSKTNTLGLRIASTSGNPLEIMRLYGFFRKFFGNDGERLEVVIASGTFENTSYLLLLALSAGRRRFVHENTVVAFGSAYGPEKEMSAEDDIIRELSHDKRNAFNEGVLRKLIGQSSLMSASNVVAVGLADGIYPRLKKDPN